MAAYAYIQKELDNLDYKEPDLMPFESNLEYPIDFHDIKEKLFPKLQDHYYAHGSYGACPSMIQKLQADWIQKMEDNPNHFFYKILYKYLVRSLHRLGAFLNTPPNSIFFITNVEYGISTVLKSLEFKNVAIFDLTYEAVAHQLNYHCKLQDAKLHKMSLQYPLSAKTIIKDLTNFLSSTDIDLFCFEHITSPTGILMPIKEIIEICRQKDIKTLIDGAHAIGQLKLDLQDLAPDFYVSNMHKWLCSPRGYVNKKFHQDIHPLVISWGYNQGIQSEFIWQGTQDFSAFLCIPSLLNIFNSFEKCPFTRNQELTKWAANLFVKVWDTELLFPLDMICCMASVVVPSKLCSTDTCSFSDLHDDLYNRFGIEVPILSFKGKRFARVSIHIYTTKEEIYYLAESMLLALDYSQDFKGFEILKNIKDEDN